MTAQPTKGFQAATNGQQVIRKMFIIGTNAANQASAIASESNGHRVVFASQNDMDAFYSSGSDAAFKLARRALGFLKIEENADGKNHAAFDGVNTIIICGSVSDDVIGKINTSTPEQCTVTRQTFPKDPVSRRSAAPTRGAHTSGRRPLGCV